VVRNQTINGQNGSLTGTVNSIDELKGKHLLAQLILDLIIEFSNMGLSLIQVPSMFRQQQIAYNITISLHAVNGLPIPQPATQ
jgi:hypothetical protein